MKEDNFCLVIHHQHDDTNSCFNDFEYDDNNNRMLSNVHTVIND